ncbi:MAG TPA: hypothetical protein VLA14_12585 [Polyangia bacterium]|nr:hypothetical protein [Polyangia bacterium]
MPPGPRPRRRAGHAAALVAAAVAVIAAAAARADEAAPPPPPGLPDPPAPSLAPPPSDASGLHVTLSPARAFLVLGTDTEVMIDVEVSGPGADVFAPTRTFATVGTLEAPRPTGAPGHFAARYLVPAERYPQVALLVVELAGGAQRMRGVLRLPLHGMTEMALRTSPLAQVTLRVGEQSFGPVGADHLGHVKIPIEVPPGLRVGTARAVDHNGNVKETEVDLQPAPFRRVLILAPDVLQVGSFVEVSVLGLDAAGEAAAPGRMSLRATEGLVHAIGDGGPGEERFLVEVPRRVGSGALALTAAVAGSPVAHAELAVPLVAAPPASLTLSPSLRRLVIGGGAQARVVVSAHDRFGNPTSAERVEAMVDGAATPVRVMAGGLAMLVVPPPEYYDGKDRIVVEVRLDAARARQDVLLTGGSPTALSLAASVGRVVADGTRSIELRVRAFDRNGTPTLVPGLSWDTPGGHLGGVRTPREGEYIAEFVPDRARDTHREVVAVAAGPALRAVTSVEVAPPPVRFMASAHFGVFSNLGDLSGPAAFLELLAPFPQRTGRFAAGLAAGYLRGDETLSGANKTTSRLEINQVPLLVVARYRFGATSEPQISAGGGAGVSLASTRFTPDLASSGAVVDATAWSVALQVDAEAAFPLRPGRLVVGVRYLWVDLGRTSQGDTIDGNTAGLMGDLGYRLIW